MGGETDGDDDDKWVRDALSHVAMFLDGTCALVFFSHVCRLWRDAAMASRGHEYEAWRHVSQIGDRARLSGLQDVIVRKRLMYTLTPIYKEYAIPRTVAPENLVFKLVPNHEFVANSTWRLGESDTHMMLLYHNNKMGLTTSENAFEDLFERLNSFRDVGPENMHDWDPQLADVQATLDWKKQPEQSLRNMQLFIAARSFEVRGPLAINLKYPCT